MTEPTVRSRGDVQDLREQVAMATRLLHHYGLAAYQGHISARVPDTELVVIRGRPDLSMDRVRTEDLMIIDLDGNVIEASEAYPERVTSWALHTEIYKARPEVRSVVHTHQKWCTVFGIAGRNVLPLLHPPTAAVAAEPWPVYDETRDAIANARQARVVARTLASNVACHLRNHGMVFVGPSVSRAIMTAADAEQMAELTWRAMLLGAPETIPMMFLRDDVERRFVSTREEEVRDGVARGEWGNQVWLDQHPHAAWERGVWL